MVAVAGEKSDELVDPEQCWPIKLSAVMKCSRSVLIQ